MPGQGDGRVNNVGPEEAVEVADDAGGGDVEEVLQKGTKCFRIEQLYKGQLLPYFLDGGLELITATKMK